MIDEVEQPVSSGSKVRERAIMHHLGILVRKSEFESLLAWHRKVLDMEVNFRGSDGELEVCFLTNDAANHRLVFIAKPDLSDDPSAAIHTGLDHFAFEFPTIQGLMAKYVELRDAGIYPWMPIDHGLTISIYYMDPRGCKVELQTDALATAPGDWDASREWMHSSPDFVNNIFGILFDPDAVATACDRGATLEEIHRAIYYEGTYPPTPAQRQPVLDMYGAIRPGPWDHASWNLDDPTFATNGKE